MQYESICHMSLINLYWFDWDPFWWAYGDILNFIVFICFIANSEGDWFDWDPFWWAYVDILNFIVRWSIVWLSNSDIESFLQWSVRCLIWLQQVIYDDMPSKFFFDLLRETDHEFVTRTGWYYRHDQLLFVPCSSVLVQPPHLPEGSRPCSPTASNMFPASFVGPDEPWISHRSRALVQ